MIDYNKLKQAIKNFLPKRKENKVVLTEGGQVIKINQSNYFGDNTVDKK